MEEVPDPTWDQLKDRVVRPYWKEKWLDSLLADLDSDFSFLGENQENVDENQQEAVQVPQLDDTPDSPAALSRPAALRKVTSFPFPASEGTSITPSESGMSSGTWLSMSWSTISSWGGGNRQRHKMLLSLQQALVLDIDSKAVNFLETPLYSSMSSFAQETPPRGPRARDWLGSLALHGMARTVAGPCQDPADEALQDNEEWQDFLKLPSAVALAEAVSGPNRVVKGISFGVPREKTKISSLDRKQMKMQFLLGLQQALLQDIDSNATDFMDRPMFCSMKSFAQETQPRGVRVHHWLSSLALHGMARTRAGPCHDPADEALQDNKEWQLFLKLPSAVALAEAVSGPNRTVKGISFG